MKYLLTIALCFVFTAFVQAQSEEEKGVKATINELFVGMQKSDSSMVANTFLPDAIMQTISKSQSGQVRVVNGSLADFLNSIQNAEAGVLNEKLSGYDIKIDGNLASSWTPYQFYRGEEFSHCGVNSFQLMKTDEGWKIFHIVDTRRREGCEIK